MAAGRPRRVALTDRIGSRGPRWRGPRRFRGRVAVDGGASRRAVSDGRGARRRHRVRTAM